MLGKLLGIEFHEISMGAEKLFYLGPFPITNTILTTWIVMALLVTLALVVRKRLSLIPGALQSVAEIVIETVYNLVKGVTGEKVGRVIFPLIMTLFIFILTANWLALMPGFGTITYHHVPIFRPPNSDLNTTLAMALITVFLVQVAGIVYRGIKGYLKE